MQRRSDGSSRTTVWRVSCGAPRLSATRSALAALSLRLSGCAAIRAFASASPAPSLACHEPLELSLSVDRHDDHHGAEAVQPRLKEQWRIDHHHRSTQGELIDQGPEKPERYPRLDELVEPLARSTVIDEFDG